RRGRLLASSSPSSRTGDAAPQHRPVLVHETGEKGVRLVVGNSLLVVDAAVQGDVEAEGQVSHANRLRVGRPAGPSLVDEFLAAANLPIYGSLERRSNRFCAIEGAGLARLEVTTEARGRIKRQIVTRDADGFEIDLHAMRTTLGTALARHGVAPQLAQRILRHADYRTTLKNYTALGVEDGMRGIEKLPPLPELPTEPERAGKGGSTDPPTVAARNGATPCKILRNGKTGGPHRAPAPDLPKCFLLR